MSRYKSSAKTFWLLKSKHDWIYNWRSTYHTCMHVCPYQYASLKSDQCKVWYKFKILTNRTTLGSLIHFLFNVCITIKRIFLSSYKVFALYDLKQKLSIYGIWEIIFMPFFFFNVFNTCIKWSTLAQIRTIWNKYFLDPLINIFPLQK